MSELPTIYYILDTKWTLSMPSVHPAGHGQITQNAWRSLGMSHKLSDKLQTCSTCWAAAAPNKIGRLVSKLMQERKRYTHFTLQMGQCPKPFLRYTLPGKHSHLPLPQLFVKNLCGETTADDPSSLFTQTGQNSPTATEDTMQLFAQAECWSSSSVNSFYQYKWFALTDNTWSHKFIWIVTQQKMLFREVIGLS